MALHEFGSQATLNRHDKVHRAQDRPLPRVQVPQPRMTNNWVTKVRQPLQLLVSEVDAVQHPAMGPDQEGLSHHHHCPRLPKHRHVRSDPIQGKAMTPKVLRTKRSTALPLM
eukprot:3114892-Amphidinium_carterae.1